MTRQTAQTAQTAQHRGHFRRYVVVPLPCGVPVSRGPSVVESFEGRLVARAASL